MSLISENSYSESQLININNELKKDIKNEGIKEDFKENANPSSNIMNLGPLFSFSFSAPITDKKIIFSRNNILQCFKSQTNTKQLQKSLIGISKENINYIINELSGNFRFSIKNKNGNYFCSNLIKICTKEQRLKIVRELSNTISQDSIDEFGTHPIQNLIEVASSEEEFQLILSSFKDFNDIIIPSLNKYGTYVIQKIIIHIPEELRINFNYIFVNFICVLSRDAYGILTVKEFINHSKDKIIIKRFCDTISINFINICENKYGNYLIQYLLKIWWNKEEGQFLKIIIDSKFSILTQNEYSSYVCDLYTKLKNGNLNDGYLNDKNKKNYKKNNYYFKKYK